MTVPVVLAAVGVGAQRVADTRARVYGAMDATAERPESAPVWIPDIG